MGSVDEYLERVFSEGLKREIDSDESVWRTLPFFATAIGIAGTLLGYDGSRLPSFSWALLPLLLYTLLGAGILCLGISFAWLFNAVRQREYRYPPSEVDLHTLAQGYRNYNIALGRSGEDLEARIVQDMRSIMVDEYAQSASTNREQNRRKLFSRSQAIFFLMVGLAICFAYGSLAFVGQKLGERPEADKGTAHVARQQPCATAIAAGSVNPHATRQPRTSSSARAAAATTDSGGCPPVRAHAVHGSSVMNDKSEPAPVGAATAPREQAARSHLRGPPRGY